MPSGNKFAVLSEVNEKKKQIVVSDSNLPKKAKKPASPTEAKPAAAAAKPAAKQAPTKKAPAAGKKADGSDAPTDLRAAMEFNRKKAEEREARAVADRAAAEAAAVKVASEQTQAEVQGEADAAKEAKEEAAAEAAEVAPKPVEKPVEKPVMTMADFHKARAENHFAIAQKSSRAADSAALKSLQKMDAGQDELVIKPKEQPKPAVPAKGGKAKPAATPAPKAEKKEKSEKLDLNQFADYSAAPRGRGGYSRGSFSGRGGFEGRGGARMPNVEDKRAFPTL